MPPLPVRSVLIAFLALVASSYALVRHYLPHETKAPPASAAPERVEIPAPELLPAEK